MDEKQIRECANEIDNLVCNFHHEEVVRAIEEVIKKHLNVATQPAPVPTLMSERQRKVTLEDWVGHLLLHLDDFYSGTELEIRKTHVRTALTQEKQRKVLDFERDAIILELLSWYDKQCNDGCVLHLNKVLQNLRRLKDFNANLDAFDKDGGK